ncbi:MAG: ECF transporter S component [Clostridiales bacterium]|nr:ECF transporter S component [Clostridiales bacterium]
MNTKKMAQAGLLTAITLVLGLTPLGIIPIPPANVTIMHLPVIIGTLTCSLGVGLVLGAAFGLSSVYAAFTRPSALVAPILAESPLMVIVMSLGARLMVPVVVHLVYKAITKGDTVRQKTGVMAAAVCGSLTNTVCYLGLMLLFYTMLGLDSGVVLGVIASAGAMNGSAEAVAAALLCTPIVLGVRAAMGKGK